MKMKTLLLRLIDAWLVACLITGIPSHRLLAATYYVDPDLGDDANSATQAQSSAAPWQSLTRALSEQTLAEGDVIRLASGDYADESEGGHETFPVELVNGVAVLGSGPGSRVGVGATSRIFEGRRTLGPDTAVMNLALVGEADSGIFLNLTDATVSPTFDGLSFGSGLTEGIHLFTQVGTGSFTGTISNSTFTCSKAAVGAQVTSTHDTVDLSFTLSNSTFDVDGPVVRFSASAFGGDVILAPTLDEVQVHGSSGSPTHESGEAVVSANVGSFRGSLTVAPTISRSTIENAGDVIAVDVDGVPADSVSVTVDSALLDSSFRQLNALSRYQISDVDMDQLTLSTTVRDISAVGTQGAAVFSVSDAAVASASFDVTSAGNRVDVDDTWISLSLVGADGLHGAGHLSISNDTIDVSGNIVSLSDLSGSGSDLAIALDVEDSDLQIEEGDAMFNSRAVGLDGGSYSLALTLAGTTLGGSYQRGLYATDSSNLSADIAYDVTAAGNVVTGATDVFLATFGQAQQGGSWSSAMTVEGNTVASSEDTAEMSFTGGESVNLTLALEVEDNHLNVSGDAAYQRAGALYGGSIDRVFTVSNNTILTERNAIVESNSSHSSVQASSQITVTDNHITGGDTGVNHFVGHLAEGAVEEEALTVAGNTFSGTTRGINITVTNVTDAELSQDVNLLSNEVDASDHGIRFYTRHVHSSVLNQELVIAGNNISESYQWGIYAHGSGLRSVGLQAMDWTISNNTVTGSKRDGLYVNVNSDSLALGSLDITVAGNTITGSHEDGMTVSLNSQTSVNPSRLTVVGNVVTHAEGDGLNVEFSGLGPGAQGSFELSDNVATDNLGNGATVNFIHVGDHPSLTLSGNTFSGNSKHGLSLYTVSTSAESTVAAADLGGGLQGGIGANSFTENGGYALLTSDRRTQARTLYAQGNFWGSSDEDAVAAAIADAGDGLSQATVDFDGALSAQPVVAATATLSAAVKGDQGLEGSSAGDTLTLTATLAGTGEVGCAAASFHADVPQGASLVAGSIATSHGTVLYGDAVDVGLERLAAGQTITVSWDLEIPEDITCGDLTVQGRLTCAQLGDVLTDDPTVEGEDDATAITLAMVTWYADADADGHGDPDVAQTSCLAAAPDGYAATDDDCDDADATTYAGAAEVCDGVDNDCDGEVDDGLLSTWYADGDADGFGDAADTTLACEAVAGYTQDDETDCDDTRSDVHPDAAETCDGVDNDCDGGVDEDGLTTFYADGDDDGYGDPSQTVESCGVPQGYALSDTDCDDADGDRHPGAAETCDGEDDDCDGATDEGGTAVSFTDADGDGFGDPATAVAGCAPGEGAVSNSQDCDDSDADIHPGATEVCDGEDDDCDGDADEALSALYYPDGDGDGYGDGQSPTYTCDPAAGALTDGSDCDDTSAEAHPGAAETCNDVDDDCDGLIDNADACDTAPTPTTGDGNSGGCDSTGGPGGPGWMCLLIVGVWIERRRRR